MRASKSGTCLARHHGRPCRARAGARLRVRLREEAAECGGRSPRRDLDASRRLAASSQSGKGSPQRRGGTETGVGALCFVHGWPTVRSASVGRCSVSLCLWWKPLLVGPRAPPPHVPVVLHGKRGSAQSPINPCNCLARRRLPSIDRSSRSADAVVQPLPRYRGGRAALFPALVRIGHNPR